MNGFDPQVQQAKLQELAADVICMALAKGASAVEVSARSSSGLAANVRLGEVETIEHTSDKGFGISVYFGQHKGSASTTDQSPAAIEETLDSACAIARFTAEDSHAGLPHADQLATKILNLDLYHPWQVDIEQLLELARSCEAVALEEDERIENSEGANVNSDAGVIVYANSLGFNQGYAETHHSLSCSVIAHAASEMQRDYWFSQARQPAQLETPEAIGQRAAQRALRRLGARRLSTRVAPVVFVPEMAASLLRSFVGAISGGALYRRASFLLDTLGEQLFPDWVQISECPHLKQGLGSASFDAEGVATHERDLVAGGMLQSYVLSSYSARQLGLETTGNAGGVRNLRILSSTNSFEHLLKRMDSGLVITEMMGQGFNPVTGDYSRGAAGLWIENGQVQYPVQEITVAGNLRRMFQDLLAVADDCDYPGNIQSGSWLVSEMTIAGE